jgi:hypothetical protein
MDNSLIESLSIVCKILNKNSVEYLIVGGSAVALHGFFRLSHDPSGRPMEKRDLDFWYNSTYKNYYKLLNVIEDLGQDVTEFKEETAPNPKKSFFKLELEKFTVDFLPELPGLSKFRSSFEKKEIRKIDEIEIPLINFDDLIINKQTQGRAKDIEDIEQLKLRRLNPE